MTFNRTVSVCVVAAALSACGKIGVDKRDEYGMTALMRAARDGNHVEAQRLIERGANVNAAVPSRPLREFLAFISFMQSLPKWDVGYTPLHYAADSGRADVAQLLMSRGADPLRQGRRAELTPMDLAIFHSDLSTLRVLTGRAARPGPDQIWLAVANAKPEIVKHLLERGADLEGTPRPFAGARPRQPLVVVAATRGDTAILRMLLAAGVDPNARDENGWSALRHVRDQRGRPEAAQVVAILQGTGASDAGGERAAALLDAVRKKDLEAVRAALRSGANPNARDDRGVPPLVLAARFGDTAIVAAMIAAGAHVNARPEHDATPLVSAIEAGRTDVVRQLIAASANVDQADHLKRTPLSVASGWKRTEIAALLLESSAKMDPRALPHAALGGSLELVKLLIARGANVRNDSGFALSEATRGCARHDNTEVVRALLDAGADPGVQREYTALHRAVGLCPIEVVRMLLARGANPNARSLSGVTPLASAAAQGKLEAVELLIAAKGDVNARDDEGKTVLQHAERHPKIQAALRRAGAR